MNTDYQIRRGFHGLLLLAAFTGLMACCQEATARSEDWEFNLAPYFWAPDVSLDLRLGENRVPFDEKFLQRDGNIKPNVGGAVFTAYRHKWTFGLGGESMDSDTDLLLQDGRPGELEFQQQRADIVLGREWYWSPYTDSRIYLNPYLGGRYRRVTLRIVDVDPPQEFDEQGKPKKKPPGDGKLTLQNNSRDWFEPLAGVKAQWFITPKLSIAASGEVDGFLENQLTWDATGWIKWHWTREFSISLGYRYQDYDFSGGSGGGAWEADGTAMGPMIGLELDFRGEPVPAGGDWTGAIGTTGIGMLPEAPPDKEIAPPPDAPPEEKEDGEGNWLTKWLDSSHHYLNQKLDSGVGYADQLLKKEDVPMVQRENSRFFIELHTRVSEVNSGDSFELKPSVKVDLKVPNLKRDLKLFITNQSVDQQRGTDVFDEDSGVNIGLETGGLFLKKTKFNVGVRNVVDPFVMGAWKPEWNHNRFRLLPEVRAYYRSDRGGGLILSCLGIYRIKDRFRTGYLPSIEYREEIQTWEWIQSLAATYIFEGDDEDYHRAFMTRFAARGTTDQGALSYLFIPLYYRAPLYKKWIYWELGPEVVWKRIDRWEPEPGIRFAITSFFWGTEER